MDDADLTRLFADSTNVEAVLLQPHPPYELVGREKFVSH
jgi:hypothetical protein